ncbi:MAG: branched-chain amino acid ABC transporter permease [Rhodobacteraceae bacterium]|nr:branched-chain amino acid ABC transporter permease [Paracoccaceae bacterium]
MKHLALFAAAIALLALAPMVLGGHGLSVMTLTLTNLVLAVGLNLVAGYCGQFSFAQAAFFGIGAYTTAIMSRDLGTGVWINLPAGIIIAGLFGLVLGVPALRVKGHFLAIVTIAFQTVVYLTLVQWTDFTGGQNGILVPGVGETSILGIIRFNVQSLESYYWLTLALAAVAIIVAWRLVHSRLGREWIAVRDDETLAQAVGVNTTTTKLSAFVASAAFAGAAGALNACTMRTATPDDFTIFISSIILAIMILGGKGTFLGPIVGAFILTIIPESLGEFSRYKMLFFGVLLILTITFLPGGIMQLVRNARTRRA